MLHTQEVISKSNEVLLDVLNIETGFRGYLLSGNAVFLEPYNRSKTESVCQFRYIGYTYQRQSKSAKQHQFIKRKGSGTIDFTEKYLAAKSPNLLSNSEKIGIIEEGKIITDKIREAKSSITNEEYRILKNRKIENEKNYHFSELSFFYFLFFWLPFLFLWYLIIKNQKDKNNELETYTSDQKLASQYALKSY